MGAGRGGTQAGRRGAPALVAVALLIVLLAGAVAALTTRASSASAQSKGVSPGEVLVADPDAGQVVAIESTNRTPRVVQSGLLRPMAVTALADGSVLVAEGGNNRILGFGGRYADGATLVENVVNPQALTTGADGTPYVTLGNGEVGKLDLAARSYVKIADGLRSPAGVTEQGGFLYIAESSAGVITQVSPTGEKSQVVTGFQQPVGIAAGPGKSLFVSDFKANRIYRLDDNRAREEFGSTVESPQQIAVDPFQPGPDVPYTVTVATKGSVQRFDQDRKRIALLSDVKNGRGVSAVPPTEKAGAAGAGPATTRARVAPPSAARDAAYDGGTPSSTYIILIVLAVLTGLLVAAGVMLVLRESKGGAHAGFEDRPLDETVFEVFGPCAAQEVDLAEAEGALRAVQTQRRGAEQQELAASRRASTARDRMARAQHARQKAARARQARARAGQREPVPGLRSEELRLRTSGGRAALVAFRSGEIDARGLEDRWQDLGESYALECVQVLGMVVAAKGQLSMDEARAARNEQRARAELDAAEDDRHHAAREIERLKEREQQMVPRIREAQRALDTCHQQHGARRGGGHHRLGRRSGSEPERPAAPPAPPSRPPVPVGPRGGRSSSEPPGGTADPSRGPNGGDTPLSVLGGAGRTPGPGRRDDRTGMGTSPAPRDEGRAGRPAASGPARPGGPAVPGGQGVTAPGSGSGWLWTPPGERGPAPGRRPSGPPPSGRPPAPPAGPGFSGGGAAKPPGGPGAGSGTSAPGRRPFAGEGWPWGDPPSGSGGTDRDGRAGDRPGGRSGGSRPPRGPSAGPSPSDGDRGRWAAGLGDRPSGAGSAGGPGAWPGAPGSGKGSRAKGAPERDGSRPGSPGVNGGGVNGSKPGGPSSPGMGGRGEGDRPGSGSGGQGAARPWPGYLDSRPWGGGPDGPPSLNRAPVDGPAWPEAAAGPGAGGPGALPWVAAPPLVVPPRRSRDDVDGSLRWLPGITG